jgi:hypothetical protein
VSKSYVGSAVWRTEVVSSGPGQPDIAARADIEIPAQNISIRWLLRRNDGRQLPGKRREASTVIVLADSSEWSG